MKPARRNSQDERRNWQEGKLSTKTQGPLGCGRAKFTEGKSKITAGLNPQKGLWEIVGVNRPQALHRKSEKQLILASFQEQIK